jgi:hypothetical protein
VGLAILCGLFSLLCIKGSSHAAFHYGMIVITQAHFALAYFFFFTSSQIRGLGSLKRVGLLLGLAAFLSAIYIANQSFLNGINLVYLYFAWHMIRDEIQFRASKEISKQERTLLSIIVAAVAFLVYIFAVGNYALHELLSHRPDEPMNILRFYVTDYRQEVSWIGGGVLALATFVFMRFLKNCTISWGAFYNKFKIVCNLFIVFLLVNILLCWLKIQARFIVDAWIFYHVTSWYWFSIQKIRKSRIPVKNWKEWGRSSVGRFNLIYGSVQLVIVLAFVFYFYGGGKETVLNYYFHPNYFNVWTLFHITLSFFPRRKTAVRGISDRQSSFNPTLVVPGQIHA